tara:strand:- start:557 stop:1042 length:486 start_codon:yes stop_codon:yes gene_type:complete
MANITNKFVGSFSELYFRPTVCTAAEIADASTWFDSLNAELVPAVAELGTVGNESNVIEVAAFGEEFKGKLAGQSDAGSIDASLFWSPRDAVHLALRSAATSKIPMSVGIKWKSDAAGTDSEYVIFNGLVSSFSIETAFDDVVKASCTIAIDGATHFDSED